MNPTTPSTTSPELRSSQLPTGVVTFLLTDIVGSTRRWDRAAEAMSSSIVLHDALVRDAVASHRGLLLKARGEGDSTFSVFQRASDAVAAALAISTALENRTWPTGSPLTLRTAIHTGEAVERDGDYYGQTVNRVARLRAIADPRQIVVSQATADLVADHLPPGVRLVGLGTHALRDISRPETVYHLVARDEGRAAVAVPPGSAGTRDGMASNRGVVLPVALRPRSSDPALVGRGDELAAVQRSLDAALRDGARFVMLTGEPGIGKTRLAAEAAISLLETGATVLYGRCDEGVGVPFQPYAEALVEYARRAPLETLASALGDDPGPLVQLVPELAEHLPVGPTLWESADPAAEQHRLFNAVASWLRSLTVDGPLVIVLDDVHAATRSTVQLSLHLVRRLRDRPVLFIATSRPTRAGPEHVLDDAVEAMRREHVLEVVSLPGLDADAVAELLAAERAHSTPDEATAENLCVATGGNPFLVAELVRYAPTLAPGEMPASIRDVLSPRVQRLRRQTREVLAVASAAGLEFELDLVGGALGDTEDELVEAVDEAVGAGLLVEIDSARYAFPHAILHRIVYESHGSARRSVLHRRLAEALVTGVASTEPSLAAADAIARHFGAAGPRHALAAMEWSARAGRQALRQLAYEDASRHLDAALGLAGDGGDPTWRCDILLDIATARARAGDAATARDSLIEAADLARRAGNVRALARAALASSAGGRGVSAWFADDVRITLLEETYGALPDQEPELRIRVAGELALALYRPQQRARRQALAREAVESVDAHGSPPLLAAALPASRVLYWEPNDTAARLAYARAVLHVAEADNDVWLEAEALGYIQGDCHELADRAGFDEAGDRLRALAVRVGGVFLPWRARICDITTAMLAGRLDEAEVLASEALAMWGDDPAPDAVQAFGYQIGCIRLLQGRSEEVVELADQALATWPDVLGVHAARAMALASANRLNDARAVVQWCGADDLANVPRDSGWLISAVMLAEAAAATADADTARLLEDALAPHAARLAGLVGPGISWGTVAHALGLLALARGDVAAAVVQLRTACDIERSFGALPWVGRSEAALARARTIPVPEH